MKRLREFFLKDEDSEVLPNLCVCLMGRYRSVGKVFQQLMKCSPEVVLKFVPAFLKCSLQSPFSAYFDKNMLVCSNITPHIAKKCSFDYNYSRNEREVKEE